MLSSPLLQGLKAGSRWDTQMIPLTSHHHLYRIIESTDSSIKPLPHLMSHDEMTFSRPQRTVPDTLQPYQNPAHTSFFLCQAESWSQANADGQDLMTDFICIPAAPRKWTLPLFHTRDELPCCVSVPPDLHHPLFIQPQKHMTRKARCTDHEDVKTGDTQLTSCPVTHQC